MSDWKVGDKVAIYQYGSICGVDTITEITKAGNIRIAHSSNLYNSMGGLRGGNSWSSFSIDKITDQQYDDYKIVQKLKAKRKKIIEKLNSIKDGELLDYWSAIDEAYEGLIGEPAQ